MAETIFHLVRTSCAWRLLPHRFPPWPTAYSQVRRWRRDGMSRAMHDRPRELAREAEGRERRQCDRDHSVRVAALLKRSTGVPCPVVGVGSEAPVRTRC